MDKKTNVTAMAETNGVAAVSEKVKFGTKVKNFGVKHKRALIIGGLTLLAGVAWIFTRGDDEEEVDDDDSIEVESTEVEEPEEE